MINTTLEKYDVISEKILQSNALCEIMANMDDDSNINEAIKEVMTIVCGYLFTANSILTDLYHEEVARCRDTQTIQS